MGFMHRSLGGNSEYLGPSFWGISGKNVSSLTTSHYLLPSKALLGPRTRSISRTTDARQS
jgi:hypothetical protein